MRILIFAIILTFANVSFGQKEKLYDEFYLNLYSKDSLKVVVLSTAKYLKSFNYTFSNDTLYVDAKLSIVKKKEEFNTVIKLEPKTNYVNFNKDMYFIETNNSFVIKTYILVKQTKTEEKKK